MTSGDKKSSLEASPASYEASSDSEDNVLSGFDEIESAFDRVSSVADALLDSIRDDSLRGHQRRDSRRRAARQNQKPTRYDYDDDDDDDDSTSNTLNSADFSFRNYGNNNRPNFGEDNDDGDDDDMSLLGDGESVDGSLVHDMKNLKSMAKSMQEELSRGEAAFQENVTNTDNAQSYFKKLQDKAEAETPKIQNLKVKPHLTVQTKTSTSSSARKKKGPFIKTDDKKTAAAKTTTTTTKPDRKQQLKPPMAQISNLTPPQASFLQELQTFCTNLFGKNINIPFLVVNIFVWILFCRLVFVAKRQLMSDDGVLAPPLMGSAADGALDIFEEEQLGHSFGPEVEVVEY